MAKSLWQITSKVYKESIQNIIIVCTLLFIGVCKFHNEGIGKPTMVKSFSINTEHSRRNIICRQKRLTCRLQFELSGCTARSLRRLEIVASQDKEDKAAEGGGEVASDEDAAVAETCCLRGRRWQDCKGLHRQAVFEQILSRW